MSSSALEKWFEGIWTAREEAFYVSFFGGMEKGMFPLQGKTFERYGKKDPDPRFLTHGVLVSKPNAGRGTWVYVTSGMSNPWGASPETLEEGGYSGLGMEFVMETPGEAPWVVGILHWLMVTQLMVATGDLQGELVAADDRVPVGGAIDGRVSVLDGLLMCVPREPCGYPGQFELASGKVDLLLGVGISGKEREFAKAQGSGGLLELLLHRGVFPVTDAARVGLV